MPLSVLALLLRSTAVHDDSWMPAYRQLGEGRWVVEATAAEHASLIAAIARTRAADNTSGTVEAPALLRFGPALRVDRAAVPIVLDGSNSTVAGGVHLWHGWHGAAGAGASADASARANAGSGAAANLLHHSLEDVTLGLQLRHRLDTAQVASLREFLYQRVSDARDRERARWDAQACAGAEVDAPLGRWLHALGDLGAFGRKLVWLPLSLARRLVPRSTPARAAAPVPAPAAPAPVPAPPCVLFLRPIGEDALDAFIGAAGGRMPVGIMNGGGDTSNTGQTWQQLPSRHWLLDQVLGGVRVGVARGSRRGAATAWAMRDAYAGQPQAEPREAACVPVIVPDTLPGARDGAHTATEWSPPPATHFVMLVAKIETVNPISMDSVHTLDEVLEEASRLRLQQRQRRQRCRRETMAAGVPRAREAGHVAPCGPQRLRMGLLLLGDQFGEVPHSLYAAFDIVLRQHYFASHVGAPSALIAAEKTVRGTVMHAGRPHPHPNVHWILLGPSLGSPFRSSAACSKMPLATLRASARELLGSFVGNISPLVCLNAEELCYVTPERASLARAMRKMVRTAQARVPLAVDTVEAVRAAGGRATGVGGGLTLVDGHTWAAQRQQSRAHLAQAGNSTAVALSKMLLHATDKYQGMDSVFRAEVGTEAELQQVSVRPISPAAFRDVLEHTGLAFCPSASGTVESTRAYEALEAGAIPVLQGPAPVYAFPACGAHTDCPLPQVHGGDWSQALPLVLESVGVVATIASNGGDGGEGGEDGEDGAASWGAVLNALQSEVQRWYARVKVRARTEIGDAVSALLLGGVAGGATQDAGTLGDRRDARGLAGARRGGGGAARGGSGSGSGSGSGNSAARLDPGSLGGGTGAGQHAIVHPYRALGRAALLLQRGESRSLAAARLLLDDAIAHLKGGCLGRGSAAVPAEGDDTAEDENTAEGEDTAVHATSTPLASWCWSHELHHALTMRGMLSSALLSRALRGRAPRRANVASRSGASFVQLGRDAVLHYEAAAEGWLAYMEPQTVRFPLISSSLPNAAVACLQLRDVRCARHHIDIALQYDSMNPQLLKTRAGVLELEGKTAELAGVLEQVEQATRAAKQKQWRMLSFSTSRLWQGLTN